MAETKKEYRFTTGPLVVSRAYLEPVKEPNQFGRWANSIELIIEGDNKLMEMRKQISACAKDNGKEKNVFEGIFKKLENTGKDPEKNEHLAGKVFFSINRARQPGTKNLTDPAERKEWLSYMANERPKAYIVNKAGKRELIPVDKLREVIYPGCVVNVVAEAYWAPAPYNKVCLDLQAVVLLEQKDRIGPPPRRRDDKDDPLLNSIAESSGGDGDGLDALFGDDTATEEEIPF